MNNQKNDQKNQNRKKDPISVIPEVKRKRKPKQQKFIDKYRAKLLTAAAVLTFATPAAITAVQDGNFNPLAAIQATSEDDISNEISSLTLSLVNSDGSELTNSTVNPYRQYNLKLNTESNITYGDNLIKVGDCFYINLPQELDYSAIQQMEASTTDFKYSIKVVDKDGQKQLRVEINDIMNLPFNAFTTEMLLPVTFADKTNGTVTLDANVAGVQSNQQTLTLNGREAKDISDQTGITLQVMDSEFTSEITEPVDDTAVLGLHLAFDIGTNDLMPGDSFTVELPKQMNYVDGGIVNIARPEMQVVGKINNEDKTMTFEVLRVPQGTGNAEAIVAQFATSFNALAIPEAGGEVTLTATTAKNSNSKTITVKAKETVTAKNNITEKVQTLHFDFTSANGSVIASDSKVNGNDRYGMNIYVDMGTQTGSEQVAPGDYVDIMLPRYMDYSGIGEMVNDTPTFKSVGMIVDGEWNGQPVKVLRTIIKQVPQASSNTVSFGFNLSVPFDIEELYPIPEKGGKRDIGLEMETYTPKRADKKYATTIWLGVTNVNKPKPDTSFGKGVYTSAYKGLFSSSRHRGEYLTPQYISSKFYYLHPDHANRPLIRQTYPYSVYTLVEIDKNNQLAANVDATKRHWSASAPQTSNSGYTAVPNAGPENYVNAYCISEKVFYLGNKTDFDKKEHRYSKEKFDEYFYRDGIALNIPQNHKEKEHVANRLKNIVAHSYPFVSEQEMRNYYGLNPNARLDDIIAATQQMIWDTLWINPSQYENKGEASASKGGWSKQRQFYDEGTYTVPLKQNQFSQVTGDYYIHDTWNKINQKRDEGYQSKPNSENITIKEVSMNAQKNNVIVTLSRSLNANEIGHLTISAPSKDMEIEQLDPTKVDYSIDVSKLIDKNLDKNHINISLDITDNNVEAEFYVYNSADSQDVMSCEMNPRKYSDKSSIEVEKKNNGKFKFLKLEAGTDNPIIGAEFKLSKLIKKTDEKKEETYTIKNEVYKVTDETHTAVGNIKGIVNFTELPAGFYLLEEEKAPEGYLKITKEYLVAVYDNGNPSALYEKNIYDKWMSIGLGVNESYKIEDPAVEIELIKTEKQENENENQEVKKLPDAIFELDKVDEEGNSNGSLEGYPKQYTTDKDGKIAIKHLTNGSYTMKEVKAPEGYVKSSEVVKLTVTDGRVYRTDKTDDEGKPLLLNKPNFDSEVYDSKKIDTYTNTPIDYINELVSLTIKKVSSEDANTFLSEAEFTITNLETKEDIETVTTKGNGEVTFKKLSPGYYSIKETKAPDGYKISDKEWVVYIDEDGHHYDASNVESASVPVDGDKLELITRNYYKLADGTLESGALDHKPNTFTLFSGKKYWGNYYLDAGEYVGVKFKDKQLHDITNIHIQQAPTGHPNDFYRKYNIQYYDNHGKQNVLANRNNEKEITLDTNISTDAVYLINEEYKSNAWLGLQAFELEEQITDSNSGADVQRAAGITNGYLVNTASKIMDINKEEGTYTQYIYINNYETKPIWFDIAHFKPSAKITLPKFNTQDTVEYKVHKVPANRVTTDLKDFNKLDFSKYTTFPENSVFASLNQGEDATELVVNFTPKAIPSYEEAHAALIEVTAKYRDGFEEQVTNLDVTSTFEYTIYEGYSNKNSATTHNTATIVNYGKGDPITGPIIVENAPFHGLQIKKTDNQGKALAGATFTLTTEAGEAVADLVSDKNGFVGFDNLTAGNYILEETSAPLGYVPTAKKWHITVKKDGTIKYKPVLDGENKKTYITEEGTFKKGNPVSGYPSHYLNLASKIITVDPANKTFTQYVYVNNYINNQNKTDKIFFDRKGFSPKVSITLPKANPETDLTYTVYNVPEDTVGKLTDFNFDPTKLIPMADKGIIKQVNGGVVEPITIDIEFGLALKYKNAAVIAITSKYEGDAITTTSKFQYHDVNTDKDQVSNLRSITAKSSAYEFSTDEQEGTIITQPINVANEKKEIPEPKIGTGRLGVKKKVLGENTAGAEFTLYTALLEDITDKTESKTLPSDENGEIIFNDIDPGVYTLKETKAPTGAIATERTWTIIVSEDGYTERIENPIEGGSAILPTGGSNQAENMTVASQSFTVYAKGKSEARVVDSNSNATIYPNNGGLMNLQFAADFNQQVKPIAGDYFIVDIPDYMHDHGINPADRNQHILANSNGEPIAVGKMVEIDNNRVIKYTFTNYAPRMKKIVLYGDVMLSIDTEVVKNDENSKQITYSVAGKEVVNAGTLNVKYPKAGANDFISLNACINYKDNRNQTFEYYIYINPNQIKNSKNLNLEVYDYINNKVSAQSSVAEVEKIEVFTASAEEMPLSFGVRNLLNAKKPVYTKNCKVDNFNYNNRHQYFINLSEYNNYFLNGGGMIAKVTGKMSLQGDYLALSAKLVAGDNNVMYYAPSNYLIVENWTYLRSNGGGISGVSDNGRPSLEVANMPENPSLELKKVDENDKPLQGAKFQLIEVNQLNENGLWEASSDKKPFDATSKADGTVTFDTIECGKQYQLIETKAPAGHQLSSEIRHIQVDKDGTIHNYWEKITLEPLASTKFSMIKSGNYKPAPDAGLANGTQFSETGAFDDDPKTLAIYDPGADDLLKAGEYIGVDLGEASEIDALTIKQAPQSNPNDYYEQAQLEYSEDNIHWVQLKTIDNSAGQTPIKTIDNSAGQTPIELVKTINARYVRLRATKDNTHESWIAIDEFKASNKKISYIYDDGKTKGDIITKESPLTIINKKLEYPKTGSIGSIIFYMIGLTGMIGSAWMFTKKQ